MTQLLDVANMARWIQRDGAERILVRMTEYLEHDFRRWEKFDKVPRIVKGKSLGEFLLALNLNLVNSD